MNPVELSEASTAIRMVETFGHFLWQGLLIAGLAEVAALFLKRASANSRYLVHLLALLALACAPMATLAWLSEPASPVFLAPPILPETEAPLPLSAPPDVEVSISLGWRGYAPQLLGLYFVGVLLLLSRLAFAIGGGWKLRKKSLPVDDETVLTALAHQAKRIGLWVTPAVAFCRKVVGPTVVGILRPTILLPISFTSGLTPEQVEMILAHELAHIRRYDHLVNLLQRIIESLLFFHPAVWWVSHRIRTEREQCCDDLVVARGAQPLAYAEALVKVASSQAVSSEVGPLSPQSALPATGNRSQLSQRVLRLIGASCKERLVAPRTMLFLFLVLLVVTLPTAFMVRATEKSGHDEVNPSEASPEEPVFPSDQVGAEPVLEGNSPPSGTKDSQATTSRVYQIEHFNATEVAETLRRLPEGGKTGPIQVTIDVPANSLTVVANETDQEHVLGFLKHVDIAEKTKTKLDLRAEEFFASATGWEPPAETESLRVETFHLPEVGGKDLAKVINLHLFGKVDFTTDFGEEDPFLVVDPDLSVLIIRHTSEKLELVKRLLENRRFVGDVVDRGLKARKFTVVRPEDLQTDSPEAMIRRRQQVAFTERVFRSLLYGTQSIEEAAAEGRVMYADPDEGTIDVVDTSENLMKVEEYLSNSTIQTAEERKIQARRFKVVPEEFLQDSSPAGRQKLREEFGKMEKVFREILYGTATLEAAAAEGRVMYSDPDEGTIDVVDRPTNLKKLEKYLPQPPTPVFHPRVVEFSRLSPEALFSKLEGKVLGVSLNEPLSEMSEEAREKGFDAKDSDRLQTYIRLIPEKKQAVVLGSDLAEVDKTIEMIWALDAGP